MSHNSPRRSKPEPIWRDLINRWKASGQSVAAFYAAHQVGQVKSTVTAHRRDPERAEQCRIGGSCNLTLTPNLRRRVPPEHAMSIVLSAHFDGPSAPYVLHAEWRR